MKANELMIGDWVKDSTQCYVRFDGIGCSDYNEINRNNGYPIRCADEDDRYVAIINEEQGRSYNEHLADIHPIPLTEEILTMNGWKDSDPNLFNGLHYVFIYGKNHTLTLNHWTNRDTNEEYYTFAIGGGDRVLKYVHELQRALRCCGLFDLADNFKI